MANLDDISNRLTPSVPIEITFATPPLGVGTKVTTLFGHMAASPGTGIPYQVYQVINAGDPAAAKTEVDTLAGVGSQIGAMAAAFINSNLLAGRGNFPNFRVVLIPSGINNFGPNGEAITAVKFLRSDMLVSCYAAEDTTNRATLLALAVAISSPDSDLTGQFGSFVQLASLAPLATQIAFAVNSPMVMVESLPDSNTGLVDVTGDTVSGSPNVANVAQVALTPVGDISSGSPNVSNIVTTGILPGATVTGTGIPVNTVVNQVLGNQLVLSANATATHVAETLTITNVPGTAGIYPGAVVTGAGIPAATKVLSVTAAGLVLSANATATASSVSLAAQNAVSQPVEIIAAAAAAGKMGSAFPYNPLTNVVLGGILPAQKKSDWIAIDPSGSSEAALNAGLSPLVVQGGQNVAYLRTRTTYTMTPSLVPVTAYFDWQDLVTLNDFREVIYDVSQSPPFNNNPGGTKNSLQTAALFKDEVLREAQSFEDQGAFQAVQSLASQFLVQPSTTSRGRFDFKIPVNVLPGLYVIAGNIQAVTTFDFTL